jgi:hypothetical protein
MKYLGINRCWKKMALECLKHAVKEGDFESVYEPEFSLFCGLAEREENEVIVELRHGADMKKKYGRNWYKRSEL